MGWNRVLAFITGNPIHQPQHALTLAAMDRMEAGLLLLPLAGLGCPRDIHYYTRTRCYQAVRPYYPPDRFLISLLPWSTRLAGAREALMQALMARNYGATDFIVRPGEEGLEKNGSGLASAEADQVWDVLKRHEKEIGLELEYIPQGRTSGRKKPTAPVTPSETGPSFLTSDDLLDRIRRGREVPSWASFPEVIQELEKDYPPPHRQGFTLFFTGLSGAGKSTLAKILYAKFLELGDRPVTLLDGDIVRRHLSSDLGFSKEDRDKNIRRIGFVASEITKNRGIAICAPIAPYARTRNEIRDQVEQYGGFFEIWVSTPLDVCEKRDRKGMYAKARKGLIKGFTGIDDPYEIPEAAELTIDTSEVSPEAAVADILARLAVTGFIRLPGTIDGEACR
jgi:sulfate adenylyltransferase